jgi:hypothetical protein
MAVSWLFRSGSTALQQCKWSRCARWGTRQCN